MRLAFVGCVAYSVRFLELLLETPGPAEVVGVATRERSAFNADFRSLAPLAAAHGRDCLLVQGNDQEALASWLRTRVAVEWGDGIGILAQLLGEARANLKRAGPGPQFAAPCVSV